MAFDVAAFRTAFPEFADATAYPTATIDTWAALAEMQVRSVIWKSATTLATQLYVAHEITIAYQNVKTATNGGAPGTFGGIANNKTVGGASIGFDATTTSEKDGGWWNLTTYGKQFLRLARIFGAGAIQL